MPNRLSELADLMRHHEWCQREHGFEDQAKTVALNAEELLDLEGDAADDCPICLYGGQMLLEHASTNDTEFAKLLRQAAAMELANRGLTPEKIEKLAAERRLASDDPVLVLNDIVLKSKDEVLAFLDKWAAVPVEAMIAI